MDKLFVTYELALLLKKLDFHTEEVFGYYENCPNGEHTVSEWKVNNLWCYDDTDENPYIFWIGHDIVNDENLILAPLWQQVIDWLEKKEIFITWDFKTTEVFEYYGYVHIISDYNKTKIYETDKQPNKYKALALAIEKTLTSYF
jgi:hypothetical protein